MIINSPEFSADFLFKNFGKCDFKIKNQNKVYPCHFQIVSASSLKIASLLIDGKHPEQIEIKSGSYLKYFGDVINFFYGSSIHVDQFNAAELVEIGYALNSPRLLQEAVPFYLFFQKKFSIEQELKYTQSDFIEPSSLTFVAMFFHWFIVDSGFLSQLNKNVLATILSCPKLRVESEDFLLDCMLKANVDPSLLRFIKFDALSPNGFKMIFDSLDHFPNEILAILNKMFLKSFKDKTQNIDENNTRYINPSKLKVYIIQFLCPDIKSSDPLTFQPTQKGYQFIQQELQIFENISIDINSS